MTAKELTQKHSLVPACLPDPEREVCGGYAGDLLSWVMGRAKSGNAWITIMSNINIVAVASLSDVGLVVVAEGVTLSDEIINTANSKGVNIALSQKSAYEISVELANDL